MTHQYFHTFVLSQIFGLYLVIMAIILTSRAEHHRVIINSIDPNGFGVFFAGCFGMLLGLFLVTIHNFWGGFFLGVLSLFFWFILIKSILVLAFPEWIIGYSKKLYNGQGYYIGVIMCAVFGVFLMADGYYLYM